MGGCDFTTNPTTNFKEIDQWHPSQDVPLKLLKNSSIWQKFNNTLNFELIRIEAFQKPVEWHISHLSNCVDYFSNELVNFKKEKEREELENFVNIFQKRIKYLQKNEKIIDYLIQKGFKITNFGFKLEELNLKNIWTELYPLGYYFRFEEEDQPFNDDVCLQHLSALNFPNVKEKLKQLLERNLPFHQVTLPLYHLLLEYYSIPLVQILERSVALYHIHKTCADLLSSINGKTTTLKISDVTSPANYNNGHNIHEFSSVENIEQYNRGGESGSSHQSSAEISDDNSSNADDDSSEYSDNTSEGDSGESNDDKYYFFTDKQRSLLEELKAHSLNKSAYLLQIKRSIRMEHKRNFNLPGERRKKKSDDQSPISHLSLLCLTNNLHVGESIDSLDPGKRCIYRKCYHIYKNSIDADLMHYLTHTVKDSNHHNHSHEYLTVDKYHNNMSHSTPSSPMPVGLEVERHVNLSSSTSSPSNVVSPSTATCSIYSTSSPHYKHIPFFIWLEGKDLEGVKSENFYHWDMIPSQAMKVTFHDGFACHPLCNVGALKKENQNGKIEHHDHVDNHQIINGNAKNLKESPIIIDGVYIYAIDENDDLYVLPKVPEDDKERKELDLSALSLLNKLYPDYLLFPNHPRLIHSANGRSLGEITFVNGKIARISNISGHYRPHGYQFYLAVIALCKNGEIFNDDAVVLYRHSTGTDVFRYPQFVKLNRKEMLLDVIKGKDRPTGLLYHVKCNCD